MKQRGNTEELLQTENMELNTFCDNMIGLFRNMQDKLYESRETQDQLTHMVNSLTKETGSASNNNISTTKI